MTASVQLHRLSSRGDTEGRRHVLMVGAKRDHIQLPMLCWAAHIVEHERPLLRAHVEEVPGESFRTSPKLTPTNDSETTSRAR